MSILIDNETIQYLKSTIDWERFGDRFKTENDYFSFPDPTLETIDKNLFYLLRNSTEVEWEAKYKYRPDYVSFDYYGTPQLDNFIMYVNGVRLLEEFSDLKTIVIPSFESIIVSLQDNFPTKDPDELQAVNW